MGSTECLNLKSANAIQKSTFVWFFEGCSFDFNLGKVCDNKPKLKFGFFPWAETVPQFTNRHTLKAADHKILKLIIPIK